LLAFLRASIATMLTYRGEIVLWAIWGVVYPAVAMAMWAAAVRGNPSGNIHGMDARDFAAYFLLMMIIGHVTAAWDIFEMGWQVRTGAMSPRLLQPVLPVWQNLADNLAYKIVTLALLVPTWALVAWIAQPRISTSGLQVALGMIAVLLAMAVHFLWNYNLALGAFWLTRTEALAELWWGSNLLLGGRMAPLSIMPWPLQWLADLLPFQWIAWFPAAALAGQLTAAQIARGLLWQLAWLIAGVVFFRLAWRFALKRYTAVGA
jgi:ABC-2 type transport system permease protein